MFHVLVLGIFSACVDNVVQNHSHRTVQRRLFFRPSVRKPNECVRVKFNGTGLFCEMIIQRHFYQVFGLSPTVRPRVRYSPLPFDVKHSPKMTDLCRVSFRVSVISSYKFYCVKYDQIYPNHGDHFCEFQTVDQGQFFVVYPIFINKF